jgi:putative membrane protein
MLPAAFKKNDRKANWLIILFSIVIFVAIVILSRVKLDLSLGFDVHVFAKINAVLNSIVAVLLVIALLTVKRKKYALHRNLMLAAMSMSILFLLSYICHHLFAGDTRFGDTNHDGSVSADEIQAVGALRIIYYALLGTHILLAGVILPFILFTAYRGLTGEYMKHKKLARITWPVWLYVAITGVVVYLMIHPYYT